MKINHTLTAGQLKAKVDALAALSAAKIRALEKAWDPAKGAPVFTAGGAYTARGWTEWTQGFQFGSPLLQLELTGEAEFLETGRRRTLAHMAPHLTHTGVHDHGFNNVSTYGTLRRLMLEGKAPRNEELLAHLETALKVSGAVQAARWTRIPNGGFIHSFNGPHSLFADTIRSLRALALAHRLGHVLMGEADRRISLLERLVQHADATARFAVYYGEGRDAYDVRGRVAHESVFNVTDGAYRCPNSQQGFSPFTTWTRGLAWVVLGYPEELEFLDTLDDEALRPFGGRALIETRWLKAAEATADFYIAGASAADGIPYWDTGAPGLARLDDGYLDRPADPFNDREPVDSSAAAIAAQGLLRLGRYLKRHGRQNEGTKYWQAGLTVANALFDDPYLSRDAKHQGLILHSVYHRPNGWDHVPAGSKIPRGESSMWGDYHARELAVLLAREIRGEAWVAFFGPEAAPSTRAVRSASEAPAPHKAPPARGPAARPGAMEAKKKRR
jgi:hypothetical protein